MQVWRAQAQLAAQGRLVSTAFPRRLVPLRCAVLPPDIATSDFCQAPSDPDAQTRGIECSTRSVAAGAPPARRYDI